MKLREEFNNVFDETKNIWNASLTKAMIKLKELKIEEDRIKLDLAKSQMNMAIYTMIKSKLIDDSTRKKINKLSKTVGLETSFDDEVDIYVNILQLIKDTLTKSK